MTGGAVIAGIALGYCYSEETQITETTNLEERIQKPTPSANPNPKRQRSQSAYPTPQYQELEEARERIREYAKEVKRKQEASTSGLPGTIGSYGLPDFSEDDEGDKPWYDLPPKERSQEKIAKGFNGALDAKDYRVAASYIDNFEEFALSGEEEKDKRAITYVIVSGYNDFLNEIIQDCQKYGYDYDSIFRKVIWMDFFLIDHQEILPVIDSETRKELDLLTLIQKGEQAIQAISDCQPHE